MKTLILSLAVVVAAATTHAQQPNLAEMASEAGVDWLLGEWAFMRSDGVEMTMSFSLLLNGHAVKQEHKGLKQRFTALIAYDPESREVRHMGADHDGGFTSGTWTAEGGKAILTLRVVKPDGEGGPMITRFVKVDAQTMNMEMSFDEAPELEGQPITMEWKRKS
jgi:hypothetical protein